MYIYVERLKGKCSKSVAGPAVTFNTTILTSQGTVRSSGEMRDNCYAVVVYMCCVYNAVDV